MIRSELVAKIAGENPGLTAREVDSIVDLFFENIAEQLAQGGRVELRGRVATRERVILSIFLPRRSPILSRARKCAPD